VTCCLEKKAKSAKSTRKKWLCPTVSIIFHNKLYSYIRVCVDGSWKLSNHPRSIPEELKKQFLNTSTYNTLRVKRTYEKKQGALSSVKKTSKERIEIELKNLFQSKLICYVQNKNTPVHTRGMRQRSTGDGGSCDLKPNNTPRREREGGRATPTTPGVNGVCCLVSSHTNLRRSDTTLSHPPKNVWII